MVTTAQDLRAAGIEIPLFVGGAALTRRFTATRIAVEYGGPTLYAKDAMDGLDLANRVFGATTREAALERLRAEQEALRAGAAAAEGAAPEQTPPVAARSAVSRVVPVPKPPDLDLHVLRRVPLAHLYPYLNLQMLLGKHLGVKGSVARLLTERDSTTVEINAVIEGLEREAAAHGWIEANALYRFFEARSSGDDLILYRDGREAARFHFPRQRGGDRLCLSDYVRDAVSGEPDYVALFAVTCGSGVRELANRWKEEGQYLRSHAIQALAIELAEALAEMLHARLRTQWGFPDPPGMALEDKLKAHYRGLRVSFGYPACPNLADQRILFDLLEPAQIGLALTEGFMMDPEASVSALVFHHPDAKYFKAE
jgi:5-methyltetrahydrofolate--homocysteine methyltransferase